MTEKAKEKKEVVGKQPYEYLADIQGEIKIGKDAYNGFGNYNYRNIEQMLTVIKPICKAHGCCLHITAKPEPIGPYMYVHAIATLHTPGGDIASDGYAREQENKKGMDQAQVTGSCNSYASKYAVQNLFGIDDGKGDPDTQDNRESGKPQQQNPQPVQDIEYINKIFAENETLQGLTKDALIERVKAAMDLKGITEEQVLASSTMGAESLEAMSKQQLENVHTWVGRQ